MKKGFTLIELLIVMVLVGVLVTIALPKYYVSMERGRVLEAVNNLRAASDFLTAQYIMNGNAYPGESEAETILSDGDYTKPVYFTKPTLSSGTGWTYSNGYVKIRSRRVKGESYTLEAFHENGELKYIACIASSDETKKLCENIGFDKQSDGSYKMFYEIVRV